MGGPSSSLLLKPDFVSTLSLSPRPTFEELDIVGTKVLDYVRRHWPWNSDEEMENCLCQDAEAWSLLACPRGPEDRAKITSEFMMFYFIYDDILETMTIIEARESVASTRRVMLESKPPENPIENIIHSICARMRSLGDNHSRKLAEIAFSEGVKYLEAVANREEQIKSLDNGLEGYLRYRIKDIAFWATLRVVAWQVDLGTPPQHIWEDHDFITLTNLGGFHEVLINDMYSYRKEATSAQIHGHSVFNAVCILLQQDGVDEANVMEKMKEYTHENEDKFKGIADKLRRRYRNDMNDLQMVNDWITLLTDFITGNWIWSGICRRYNK